MNREQLLIALILVNITLLICSWTRPSSLSNPLSVCCGALALFNGLL
jgi:hypothetical protein